MAGTSPPCHPDRPHYARGRCGACYERDQRRAALRPRRCALCPAAFTPPRDPRQIYCSTECRRVSMALRQSARRGKPAEQVIALRNRDTALEVARTFRARGYQRIGHRAPSRPGETYFAAWHRGGGLYLIRASVDPQEREEAA